MLGNVIFGILIFSTCLLALYAAISTFTFLKYTSAKESELLLKERFNLINQYPIEAQLRRIKSLSNNNPMFKPSYTIFKDRIYELVYKDAPRVRADIIEVQSLNSRRKYRASESVVNQLDGTMLYINSEIEIVSNQMERIISIEKYQREELEKYKEILDEIERTYKANTIGLKREDEHILRYIRRIEKLFDDYSQSISLVDFEKIQVFSKLIQNHMKDLAKMCSEIPMIVIIKTKTIPHRFNELKEVIDKTPHAILQKLNVYESIDDINSSIEMTDDLLQNNKIDDVKHFLTNSLTHINVLKQLIKLELKAARIVENLTTEISEDAGVVIKMYQLLRQDLSGLTKMRTHFNEVEKSFNNLTQLSKNILASYKVYSDKGRRSQELPSDIYGTINDSIEDIISAQKITKHLSKFVDNKVWETKRAHDEIMNMKLLILELEGRVIFSKNTQLLNQFTKDIIGLKEKFGSLEEQLNTVISSSFNSDLENIKTRIFSIIENISITFQIAAMAEHSIIYINRYRHESEELEEIVSRAEIHYYNFEFKEVLELIIPALNRIQESIKNFNI